MIGIGEYRRIVLELMDELPDEFFRELSGGVIVSEASPVPDYAKANDLYTMGLYQVCSGVRQITMYKGSFDRVHPNADAAQAKNILRGVLRHEMRHHLESLGSFPFGSCRAKIPFSVQIGCSTIRSCDMA